MEQYLNTPIKEIIDKFPPVGEILEQYGIGCVPCNVGSCLLKDIMEIHNLPEDKERELLTEIAGVFYPGREVEIPKIERKHAATSGKLAYSPPMKKLVDEHVIIKKLLALVPAIIENLDLESEPGRQTIIKSIEFIRAYADKYHHAKEEEILFKYFDENLDIIKVIHQDHEAARAHVRAVLEGLDEKDKDKIAGHLGAYRELLTEHIRKEDEILYPWMDRNLSTSQVGELFSKFNRADAESDDELIDNCKKFVLELEDKMRKAKR